MKHRSQNYVDEYSASDWSVTQPKDSQGVRANHFTVKLPGSPDLLVWTTEVDQERRERLMEAILEHRGVLQALLSDSNGRMLTIAAPGTYQESDRTPDGRLYKTTRTWKETRAWFDGKALAERAEIPGMAALLATIQSVTATKVDSVVFSQELAVPCFV